MTRRTLRWIGWGLLALVALPVLAVAVVLSIANMDVGQRLIERQTLSLTGGMVRIEGLGGRFPDALTARRIQVSDARGVYVSVAGLALDWSPLMLLKQAAQVDRLQAAEVDMARLPVSEGPSTSSKSGSFNLPVRVDLRRLDVAKLVVNEAVAGQAATLSLVGSGELSTLTEGTLHLTATRLDSPGRYRIDGDVTSANIKAAVTIDESPTGLIASFTKLPALGAIGIRASVTGPRQALETQLGVSAGPLLASASGTIDLVHMAADLAVHAQAPAMQPAPGIAWRFILLDSKLHGPFSKPDATGTVRIEALEAGGAQIGVLAADLSGNAGQVALHATIGDLHLPGPTPDVLAASPVGLDLSARLDAADRPVIFAVAHPLIGLSGTARTAGVLSVAAALSLPELAPLARIGGIDLAGSAKLDLTASKDGDMTAATVKGGVAITGGMTPVPTLIGPDGRVDIAATMRSQTITLSHLNVDGKSLAVSASGLASPALDLDWSVSLADLAAVQPDLAGRIGLKGHARGALDDVAVRADIDAELAAKGYRSGHIVAHVDASGLPNAPRAEVTADGVLLDAPLTLAVTADRIAGVLHADIGKLAWKSLQAKGNVSLAPAATLPTGHMHIDFSRLADLTPLLGRSAAGAALATLDANDQSAHLAVTVRDASVAGIAAVGKAKLDLSVTDPKGQPVVAGAFVTDGISASGVRGVAAKINANGRLDALDVTVTARATELAGQPGQLTAAGVVDATVRRVALARLEASWKQQMVKLLAAARVSFADGVAVDRLRLGYRQAELMVAGSAGSRLDLTATLRNLPADIAAIAAPSLAADGVIAADLRLTGTSAAPEGSIKLTADRVRLRQGPGQALPAAALVTDATLLGHSARVNIRLTAGASHVTVIGTAPLSATGAVDLHTDGRIDLAMLDPLLSAQGRRARGEITANAAIVGTSAAPRVTGSAELRNGDVADTALGAHVSQLTATLQASGEAIRLVSFTGKAGPGSLGGSGTISLAGQMPVDLHFTADNARPLASDLLSALIDANLTVQGEVRGDLQAAGTLHVRRADIRIPDKLPPGIAVLPVRRANAPPPVAVTAPPSAMALNLTLDAPQQVFIRGRGLDAELGGVIHIKGTASAPIPDGGLSLRRGTLSVIGTTLNFTEGSIGFTGAGLSDPSVHFVASSTNAAIVATLTVSGSAKDPKITLSSVPDLPQDEILAQLLFNTSTSKLSPLQLAQIATALASLSGATGGFDPLESLRTAFGLDRLSVGSGTAGAPTLEAGRYVARGVYVGAKQSTSGGGPQATVQVDLAKGLKLETTAGSGSTSATGSASSADAASVGLTYQFEY